MLIDRAGLQAFLDSALEVDEQARWRNSPVALCHAEGALSLEDGRTGRWLVRPGGLGQLRWTTCLNVINQVLADVRGVL